MADIRNINRVYDISPKTVSRKLSFEVGQNILAKVVNLDKLTGEVLLKLLDGWQFSAKLQNQSDKLPEGLTRFVVEGFEEGKLQLKVLNPNAKKESSEKDPVVAFLKEQGSNLSDSDYEVLEKMVKHNITLTKENISDVKTMLDFIKKVKADPSEEDAFIQKYIQNKNIQPDSNEAAKIKSTLKSFFNELKNLSTDDLFVFFENNIDLTEENIKSFNNVFKGNQTIFDELKQVKVELADGDLFEGSLVDKNFDEVETFVSKDNLNNTKQSNNLVNKEDIKNLNGDNDIERVANNSKDLKGLIKSLDADAIENGKEVNLNNLKDKESTKNAAAIKDNNIEDMNEANLESKLADNIKSKSSSELKHQTVDEFAKAIKEQISVKTEEMKNTIKTFIEQKDDMDPKVYNNIIQALDKNINDFKIFNTVSNQYYYLDLPVNIENHQYDCKLMIKDERSKGKKIDSTNVKIAASVNTINMGVVDAYIKVSNLNMDLDIKCGEEWIKTLDKGKEQVIDKLQELGYNVYANVSEKEREMNITSCSDFFGDNNLSAIDRKV